MSGVIPSFITGATAKLKLAGLTMAYAQDVSYRVTVMTIPVERIGAYEAASNEPVAYMVSGSLAIIRYTKAASAKANDSSTLPKLGANGNGIGNWGNNAGDQMNPANMIVSQTFDLSVFQKTAKGVDAAVTDSPEIINIRDVRLTSKGGDITKRGVLVERFDFVAILASDDSQTVGDSGDSDLV